MCRHYGNRFYTAQEPEWLVQKEQIGWVKHKPLLMRQGTAEGS